MSDRGTVLVVDDELGPRESLRMILKPAYEVLTASHGVEALRTLQARKIDLVTLDLLLPGIFGIEVLKEIKKIQEDVEVIIVTGFSALTYAKVAMQYGAADFISKPFDIPEILTVVGKSMERRNFILGIQSSLSSGFKHSPYRKERNEFGNSI